ncbi:MAG: hypothetical protein HYT71_04055 [Candidatus Aenigmarchaeota archaeon]|nr:hypothetical protein [Candidatus Aenigmarchaeota archaeon]
MHHYVFNLEIEPRYFPQPMGEERTEPYNVTVKLLAELGILGQLTVRDNGMIERSFQPNIKTRKAYFDIFDREQMGDIDFTDPVQRDKLINAAPGHAQVAKDMIRSFLARGIGSYGKLIDTATANTIRTPLGRQSLNIHYEGGRLEYIAQKRHGLLRRKNFFLEDVAADYILDGWMDRVEHG